MLLLAYVCLSFGIQVVILSGQLAREELRHSISLPKILAPAGFQLKQQHSSAQELILEVQLPNILFGVQIFWELQLKDPQTRHSIKLRYRLRSGPNRICLPLHLLTLTEQKSKRGQLPESLMQQYRNLLAQFQRGLYHSDNQCFYVRDWLCCLHMRYRIKQHFELAVLAPSNVVPGGQNLHANTSQEPLSTTVHKFAQEGFSEQRPYYPGDDPRRINWKLYSRFDELYVRIPEEQQVYSQDLHCYFLPDMACYPKTFRQTVLDTASSYFLGKLKTLHLNGYRIVVHIPGEEITEQGLLYQEQNEERVLRALAAYPLHCNLDCSQRHNAASSQSNPLLRLLQGLSSNAGSSSSHLVFSSPHSIDSEAASPKQTSVPLSDYFPSHKSLYLPLPEPSQALREDLLRKPLLRLLPTSLLLHWLLRPSASEKLATGSAAYQLYQKLGQPMLFTTNPSRPQRGNLSYFGAAARRSYPRLLGQLWAWKNYYRHPERRYSVGKRSNSL